MKILHFYPAPTIKLMLTGIILLLITACTRIPEGLQPVGDFEIDRYLGQWHEIARLDHSFERDLTQVTASYSLRKDGGIDVLNRGFNPKTGAWKEARGRAYFLGEPTTASLKVSFFGPFYGGYHIIALDHETYRYALISGPSRDYLWVLARDKELPAPLLNTLLNQAKQAGFATQNIIMVDQKNGHTHLPFTPR